MLIWPNILISSLPSQLYSYAKSTAAQFWGPLITCRISRTALPQEMKYIPILPGRKYKSFPLHFLINIDTNSLARPFTDFYIKEIWEWVCMDLFHEILHFALFQFITRICPISSFIIFAYFHIKFLHIFIIVLFFWKIW